MHELSLMEEVRRLALAEIARQGGGRLRALTLRVGTLAGVDPEALRFAFTVLMEEEPTAGATLTLEPVPATALCQPCGVPFACPDGLIPCPSCGAISAALLGGRELELVSLAFDPPQGTGLRG
ncbi:MAG: hydrogenase maturation nickel metallochaperone HypA [Synechococcaceae cyanobacterium]|nr:hydrogenase maturation nickel metallochaperone HypA [Synechococcaceae cyanobacterium]